MISENMHAAGANVERQNFSRVPYRITFANIDGTENKNTHVTNNIDFIVQQSLLYSSIFN